MWRVSGFEVGRWSDALEAKIVVWEKPSEKFVVRIVQFDNYRQPRFATRARAENSASQWMHIKEFPREVKRELRRLYPLILITLSNFRGDIQ